MTSKWEHQSAKSKGHLELLRDLLKMILSKCTKIYNQFCVTIQLKGLRPSPYTIVFWMGQSQPLFVYFRLFYKTQTKYNLIKSIDGVLGTQTRGGRIEGADKSTDLWWHPMQLLKNGPTPAPFPIVFVFQTHITNFTTNMYVKKCPSSIRCGDLNSWPLEHESSPITIRPGLPHAIVTVYLFLTNTVPFTLLLNQYPSNHYLLVLEWFWREYSYSNFVRGSITVWIQLYCYINIGSKFTRLFESDSVKQEVSCRVILPFMK